MRKRTTNVFSLAFLDVMSCGFGAIILFFMIINSDTEKRKEQVNSNLQGAVEKLETEVSEGSKYLVELKNSIERVQQKVDEAAGLSNRVIEQIELKKNELAESQKDTLATIEHINKLKAELKALEEANKRLEGGANEAQSQGDRLLHFEGIGQRQYITGLKITGSHLVILVDSSASMLADRIVNIVRNRNLPERDKRRAAKWQQVVRTVEWISTRIPPDSKFQIIPFNNRVRISQELNNGKWLDGNNPTQLRSAISSIRNTVPANGTSFYHVFEYIERLDPKPDSIYLLTDGLPTQGGTKPTRNTVNAKQRLRYFNEAIRELPGNIPVTTILYPMEGDPYAASVFWQLAARSSGAFFSPSKDWP